MALTNTTNVKAHMGISGSTYDTKLNTLITVVSNAIVNFCDRGFESTAVTEYHTPKVGPWPGRYIQVKYRPITAISRLATCPDTAIIVQNTDATTNQRATVAVTSTGLTLYRIASGSATTSTLAFATYTTMTTLAAAVTALSNGWTATVQGNYGNLASGELRSIKGALGAFGCGAELTVYTDEPGNYDVRENEGIVYGNFALGFQQVRIDYTGGYSSIPAEVDTAACMLVNAYFNSSDKDATLQSEKIGDYSYVNRQGAGVRQDLMRFCPEAADLLATYRTCPAL